MANALGALASLANYESSSDDEDSQSEMEQGFDSLEKFLMDGLLKSVIKESVRRVEYARSIRYRNHEAIEIDDSSSSLEEASPCSNSDSDSDDCLSIQKKDGANEKKRKAPPKVKGELLPNDLPLIEDLQISVPEYECLQVGTISSIVEQMVVVKADQNTPALDIDTVLFLEKGKRPLGKVFDVMGPVVQPFYCVRFNSREHVDTKNIIVGSTVFFAPRTDHTAFIFLPDLMKMKGTDASWENDNEPPPSHMDFSDDEAERQAKHGKKREKKEKQEKEKKAYVPPNPQTQRNNAFYRRDRRYNPRNQGPITWNSVHTQHMQQGQNHMMGHQGNQFRPSGPQFAPNNFGPNGPNNFGPNGPNNFGPPNGPNNFGPQNGRGGHNFSRGGFNNHGGHMGHGPYGGQGFHNGGFNGYNH